MNEAHDPFLKQWELDLTTKESRNRFAKDIDMEKQGKTEKDVTRYLQENFTFIVFRFDDKDERLKLESKIISTVSSCKDCKASKNWLGNFSPKEKIKASGLWLVNELYKEPMDKKDMATLRQILIKQQTI